MALTFTPYPLPPQNNNLHPVARAADGLSKALELYTNYSLEQQKMDQAKEQARQQRVLDYLRLRGQYGDQIDDVLKNAGVNLPGMPTMAAATPAATPVQPTLGAASMLGTFPDDGSTPTPTPAAAMPTPVPTPAAPTPTPGLPRPTMPTDVTPEHLAEIRKHKGDVGGDKFIKDQEFFANQAKIRNELDQNAPANRDEAHAFLGKYGDAGHEQAEALATGFQNKIPRPYLLAAYNDFAMAGRTHDQQNKWQYVVNPATGEGTWVKPPSPNAVQTGQGGAPATPQAIPVTQGYTPAQKQVDDAYAKDYSDWVLKGGYAETQKQISNLGQAIQRIQANPDVSGKFSGLLPQKARAITNPEAAGVERMVRDAVVKSLRQTFGPQFTEAEGERLIANTYNPQLSAAENIRSLSSLQSQLGQLAKAKNDAAAYYQQHGSLAGYQGKTSFSVNDLMPAAATPVNNGSPAPTMSPTAGAGQGAGRYQQAIAAAQEALRVNPNDEKAKRTLQIAQQRLASGAQ